MARFSDIRVLLVDDSRISRRLTRIYLEKMGIKNTVEASNGKLGLEKMKTGIFDLIISDWNMPAMSGLSFLKAVRKDKATRKIPVLMLTAEGLQESISEALDAGVTKYLLKPCRFEALKEEIETIFE